METEYPRYRDHIVVDPQIMVGKPVVRSTRIPVELVLKRLAQNPDLDALREAYPRLSVEDIQACLEYAQGLVEGESIYSACLTAMKFLLDESADFPLAKILSELGHDVKAIARDYPNALRDEVVLTFPATTNGSSLRMITILEG